MEHVLAWTHDDAEATERKRNAKLGMTAATPPIRPVNGLGEGKTDIGSLHVFEVHACNLGASAITPKLTLLKLCGTVEPPARHDEAVAM
jgi:hypothetical protein